MLSDIPISQRNFLMVIRSMTPMPRLVRLGGRTPFPVRRVLFLSAFPGCRACLYSGYHFGCKCSKRQRISVNTGSRLAFGLREVESFRDGDLRADHLAWGCIQRGHLTGN